MGKSETSEALLREGVGPSPCHVPRVPGRTQSAASAHVLRAPEISRWERARVHGQDASDIYASEELLQEGFGPSLGGAPSVSRARAGGEEDGSKPAFTDGGHLSTDQKKKYFHRAVWWFAPSAIRRGGRLGETRRNALRRQVTSAAGSNA
eukprot:5068554-Pyramimonas_sp.AAC.1